MVEECADILSLISDDCICGVCVCVVAYVCVPGRGRYIFCTSLYCIVQVSHLHDNYLGMQRTKSTHSMLKGNSRDAPDLPSGLPSQGQSSMVSLQ